MRIKARYYFRDFYFSRAFVSSRKNIHTGVMSYSKHSWVMFLTIVSKLLMCTLSVRAVFHELHLNAIHSKITDGCLTLL